MLIEFLSPKTEALELPKEKKKFFHKLSCPSKKISCKRTVTSSHEVPLQTTKTTLQICFEVGSHIADSISLTCVKLNNPVQATSLKDHLPQLLLQISNTHRIQKFRGYSKTGGSVAKILPKLFPSIQPAKSLSCQSMERN